MTAPFQPTDAPRTFTDPAAAVAALQEIYSANTFYLQKSFAGYVSGDGHEAGKRSAFYPYVAVTTTAHAQIDPRLAYGFVPGPGRYMSTVTRPDIFASYYLEQFTRLLANHQQPLEVGVSAEPIPVHFAYPQGLHIEAALSADNVRRLPDLFDVPNLATMDDETANGDNDLREGTVHQLSLFTASRVDYSLHRLRHYTATEPDRFQNYIIFTNYQFYVDEFVRLARAVMLDEDNLGDEHGYTDFVEPGGYTTHRGGQVFGEKAVRLPQMPAYHLRRADNKGITLINIGVGPSNAKTITDHLAVLRPHAWLMVGHCAGLRSSQRLGDYVLAHAYVRDDHVLDADLPLWVPIPALSEVQTALEESVGEVSGLTGYEVKTVMRTGTVVTLDNRNWELRRYGELVARFGQSRAIAVDMESATIAANGYRFRVPYGTLLCVSDKPLHGEIKLAGMADTFYRQRVDQHLQVGIRAMEKLAALGLDRLHSRKLRSFFETAFQ